MKKKLSRILVIGLLIAFLSVFPLVFINISTISSIKGKIITNRASLFPISSDSSSIASKYFTWGGSGDDGGYGIATDALDNIFIAGFTSSFGAGGYDAFLVKYNSVGVQQWNTTWGSSGHEQVNRVALDSLGNIYIVGDTDSFGAGGYDVFLAKFNNAGIQLWNTTWGGTSDDRSLYMSIDPANNIFITGYTESFGAGGYDAFLVKYNSTGTQQWNTTWGGQYKDVGYGVYAASENNIYLAGWTLSYGTNIGYNQNTFIADYNSSGAQQWNTTWGLSLNVGCRGITADSFGNIYIVSQYKNPSYNYDAILIKFNSTGAEQWYRTWGGLNNEDGFGVAIDSMNYIYITGETNSYGVGGYDVFLAKYNTEGIQMWNTTWGSTNDDISYFMTINSMDDVYITGKTDSFGAGGNDAFILIYSIPQLVSISEPNPNPNGTDSLQWKASTSANSYNIYRSNQMIEDITNMAPIATVEGTNYTDNGLPNGNYYYFISALYVNGESGPSDPLSITITNSTIHILSPLDLLKNILVIVLIVFVVALVIIVSILTVAAVGSRKTKEKRHETL